jgi:hypothetical protein
VRELVHVGVKPAMGCLGATANESISRPKWDESPVTVVEIEERARLELVDSEELEHAQKLRGGRQMFGSIVSCPAFVVATVDPG